MLYHKRNLMNKSKTCKTVKKVLNVKSKNCLHYSAYRNVYHFSFYYVKRRKIYFSIFRWKLPQFKIFFFLRPAPSFQDWYIWPLKCFQLWFFTIKISENLFFCPKTQNSTALTKSYLSLNYYESSISKYHLSQIRTLTHTHTHTHTFSDHFLSFLSV